VIFSFALLDRKIIDARDAEAHQAMLVEFPVLVAIAAEPIPAVIVPVPTVNPILLAVDRESDDTAARC
jgi:hypothetical protein